MTTRQRGFTLLEMMIALALFALLGLSGFQILQGVLRNGEISREHADRLGSAQHVFSLLEQDISQALEPPLPEMATRNGKRALKTQAQPAQARPAEKGPTLRLLRRNWLNPGAALPRSSLEWVQWQLGENGLQRRSLAWTGNALWQEQGTGDAAVAAAQPRETLFPQISDMRLRYWQNGRWLNGWFASRALPQAIEVTLSVTGYGELQRVFFITEAK